MMAFSLSVLLVAAPKFGGYTTSDSGYFQHLAEEIVDADGMVTRHDLSHPPHGLPVGISDQLQPLVAAMIYKGLHPIFPEFAVEDITRHLSAFFFVLMFIPVFLIGKELAGDLGGCAAVFFLATMASCPGTTSPVYWSKVGAFDRDVFTALLATWVIYATIRVFRTPRDSTVKFAVLAGLTYGLFPIAWGGYPYLMPIIVAALVLILLNESFAKGSPGWGSGAIWASIRANTSLIYGVAAMLGVAIFVAGTLGGHVFGPGLITWGLEFVGLKAPAVRIPQYASEMQPSTWGSLYGFYGDGLLTAMVFGLVALALIKVFWSRRREEWILLPWLAVVTLLAVSQTRFLRLWWPLLACLAGVGLVALALGIRRLSVSQMASTSEWLNLLRKPIVIAICLTLLATPFIHNAYAQAERTGPPMAAELHNALVEAFGWLRENTPENSVVAIQWSYGHLLTAVAKRPSVVDGSETFALEGRWENDPDVIIRPPDYIWRPREGRDALLVGGRRVDVDRLFSVDDDEKFAGIIRTYRENYGLKMDYIVFDLSTSYYAIGNAISGARLKAQARSRAQGEEEGTIVFGFGENRENVVFDQWVEGVYLRVDDEKSYLTGYVIFTVYPDGTAALRDFNFLRPNPEIPETLVLYVDENNNIAGAGLVELSVPMSARIFYFEEDIDYLQLRYTSSNEWVRVYEIVHENLPG